MPDSLLQSAAAPLRLIDRMVRELSPTTDGVEQVIACVLRYCRDHVAVVRGIYDAGTRESLLRATATAFASFAAEELDTVDLEDQDIHSLLALVKAQVSAAEVRFDPEISDAIVARGLADGFDRELGPRCASRFRLRGTLPLREGDPFPVLDPGLKQIFGRGISTLPESLGQPLEQARHIHIRRHSVQGLHVDLETDFVDAMANVGTDATLAVIWTTSQSHFDWDFVEREGHCCFRSVRPLQRVQVMAEACKKLAHAQTETVDIVLFPELSFDPAGVEELVEWVAQQGNPFALFVPGSAHDVDEHGHAVNVSTMVFANGGRVEHRKWNRFETELPRRDNGLVARHLEDISGASPRVRLVLADRWSVVTLICKDFMDDGVAELLAELRARIVLVPAWSERTEDFESKAEALGRASQGIVLVANAPVRPPAAEGLPDPAAAIVARPIKSDSPQVVRCSEVSAPALRIFALLPPK